MFCPLIKDECKEDCQFSYKCDDPNCSIGWHCVVNLGLRGIAYAMDGIAKLGEVLLDQVDKGEISLPKAVQKFIEDMGQSGKQ